LNRLDVTDSDFETAEKMSALLKTGWREMTVAELTSHLAGLPPMMEVFSDSDGIAMFVNGTEVQTREKGPPFLRLQCSATPKPPEPPSTESVEVQTARKAQVAMHLAHNIGKAESMPTSTAEDPSIHYGESQK